MVEVQDRLGSLTLDAARAVDGTRDSVRRGVLKHAAGAMDEALSDLAHTIVLEPSHTTGFPPRGALLYDLGRFPRRWTIAARALGRCGPAPRPRSASMCAFG
jgi:hypothetical protein